MFLNGGEYLIQYLNWPTSSRSSVDICANCAAAFWESPAPCEVVCAASATPAMFLEISLAPRAASVTLRDISLVVAFCSSTAVAMVLDMSLIFVITALIKPMASTALLVSPWMVSIFRLISSVALAVCLAAP